MHLETIEELLNLPELKVFQVIESTDDAIYLLVVPVDDSKPAVCCHCGMVHTSVHSRGSVLVEDQRMSGRRVFLYLDKRKIRCNDGHIRVEELPWLRGRFTRRFAEQVFRLTSIATNTEAGWFLGLDDEVVYRIDKTILQEKADVQLLPPPAPKAMSVDEVAWKKGHSPPKSLTYSGINKNHIKNLKLKTPKGIILEGFLKRVYLFE